MRRRWTRRPDRSAPPTFPDPWSAHAVLAVAHPAWRGVRTAASGFGDPVVEVKDAGEHATAIVTAALEHGVRTIVLHGHPPGGGILLRAAHDAGVATRAVVHSSMAQHGGEAHEATVMDALVGLAAEGVLDRIGFVKAGHAEAFDALDVPATWTPNRAPDLTGIEPVATSGPGLHVGVFAEPFWRKNVVTQLASVALLDDATAHVMQRPKVSYLESIRMIEHGELPWRDFVAIAAGMDINLYVTLSECHPLTPVESYLSGVPCLVSRTSGLFDGDDELYGWSTVDRADDPTSIAHAARRLLDRADEAVPRAVAWIERADRDAAARWADFTAG